MQETASAFSTKTLFVNSKVYSSKTKNTEAIHPTNSDIFASYDRMGVARHQTSTGPINLITDLVACVLLHGKNPPLHLP